MAYLKHIVSFINEQLNNWLLNDKLFGSKMIVGVAQQLPRREGNGIQLIPSYVADDGEAAYVGPDDDYDYIAYHRVNSLTVGKAAVNRGYGDGRGYDANVISVSYVVFARRDRLKMTNDELALYLQVNWPEAAENSLLQQLQLKACNINVSNIIMNDLQVFQEEFQGVDFFLKPEQFLMKINYTVESAFLKKCFTICESNCN